MTEYVIDIEAVKCEREAMQNDVGELLRIIGVGDHARPVSSHIVMQDEIIPTVTALVKLRDGLLRNANLPIDPLNIRQKKV